MSISPSSLWRGCAANFPQPVTEEDELAAQFLVETVYYFNCHVLHPYLGDIDYRISAREQDVLNHVFRWDVTPYEEVFENGFSARRQADTPDATYYSLEHYVHYGGRPTDSRRFTTSAFVSTTRNSGWHPIGDPGTSIEIYRYEIYAPGGIDVAETLGEYYRYPAQDEVCFVAGVARQYIRSAQLFRLTTPTGSRNTRRERVNNDLVINARINPQSHPYRALRIRYPVDYRIENNVRVNLHIIYHPGAKRQKRSTGSVVDWYAVGAAETQSYVNAAFRSSLSNEAYLFMKDEYVRLNYAPDTTDDKVLNGPLFICDGYPSLTYTSFAEYGIDCAFGSSTGTNEAFIFTGNLCALINFAPGTTDDKIIKGPMTIATMFPFFKGTVFENGVDAAFESTTKYEAYLFKDDQNARINYEDSGSITVHPITQGFPCLKGTIFENGVDAAFASHISKEAYLFKGDSYARINFAPGTLDDYIIDGVKKIRPNWPSLSGILPRENHGVDVHDSTKPVPDRDHDEL